MLAELLKTAARFDELEKKLSDPEIIQKAPNYRELLKEHGSLAHLVGVFREYDKLRVELEETQSLAKDKSDPEMRELAESELPRIKKACALALEKLKDELLSSEDDGDRNVIIEFRAGTGGDESALFVGDLVRMYQYYCEKMRWKTEVLDSSPAERGGFKDLILGVSGIAVYSHLKYESGGHRVQRVPETESQGRVHTSAATIAVLPEAEEIEVNIRAEDVRKDLFCSSGPGGQSVNTTYSAVRLTHLPTGIVVSCQDEKSQVKNTEKAMRVLRSRVYDQLKQAADSERASERSLQIGSGDRSQRIRTYNFPQNRLTEHRIGLTLYDLANIMKGEIDEIINSLREEEKRKRFAGLEA